jgi:hypothetical protein
MTVTQDLWTSVFSNRKSQNLPSLLWDHLWAQLSSTAVANVKRLGDGGGAYKKPIDVLEANVVLSNQQSLYEQILDPLTPTYVLMYWSTTSHNHLFHCTVPYLQYYFWDGACLYSIASSSIERKRWNLESKNKWMYTYLHGQWMNTHKNFWIHCAHLVDYNCCNVKEHHSPPLYRIPTSFGSSHWANIQYLRQQKKIKK